MAAELNFKSRPSKLHRGPVHSILCFRNNNDRIVLCGSLSKQSVLRLRVCKRSASLNGMKQACVEKKQPL